MGLLNLLRRLWSWWVRPPVPPVPPLPPPFTVQLVRRPCHCGCGATGLYLAFLGRPRGGLTEVGLWLLTPRREKWWQVRASN